jgi:hypothetical protein
MNSESECQQRRSTIRSRVRLRPGITSRRVLCGGLVHALLDGHFDRILILSPICPRDLR